jgi:hypothetical protein
MQFSRAACDPDGFFEIPGLDPGTAYRVTAMAPGHAMEEEPSRCLPGEVGEIRLRRIYLSVFGLRRNGVDLTPEVRWGSYMQGVRVNAPRGYQRAFREFPRGRFPASIECRLRELVRDGGVCTIRTSQPRTEPVISLPHLTLRVLVDRRAALYAVPIVPIGEKGWDRRIWIDLPPGDSEAPGTLVVRNERYPLARFRVAWVRGSGLGTYFDTHYDAERKAQVVILPQGEYEVRWLPDPGIGGFGSWKTIVRSGKLTEVPVDLGQVYELKFDPRLPTGGEVRELTLEVTVPMAMRSIRYSFPNLCVDGPESIQIASEHDDQGWLRLVAHKPGYEKVTGAVKFGDEDLTWSPVLEPIPSER